MIFRVALLNVLNIAEVLVDSRLHEVENSFRLSEDIMSTSQPTGTPAKLSELTQQRLNSYALAAAAVGMLALTQPAEAEIAFRTSRSSQEERRDQVTTAGQPNQATLTAPTPEPTTLGLLAIGAHGLSVWRRESVLQYSVPDHPNS
jgi:hypothetical protein